MHAPDDKPKVANPSLGARFVRATTVGTVRVVELHLPSMLDSDEFDHLNAALLAEVATTPGLRCVLDLSAVEYMGSSMLGLMVNARQRIKSAGGKLVLCGMSPWLIKTFRTCSLEKLFVTAHARPEAVKLAEAK